MTHHLAPDLYSSPLCDEDYWTNTLVDQEINWFRLDRLRHAVGRTDRKKLRVAPIKQVDRVRLTLCDVLIPIDQMLDTQLRIRDWLFERKVPYKMSARYRVSESDYQTVNRLIGVVFRLPTIEEAAIFKLFWA